MAQNAISLTVMSIDNTNLAAPRLEEFYVEHMRNVMENQNPYTGGTDYKSYDVENKGNCQFVYNVFGEGRRPMIKYTVNETFAAVIAKMQA